MTISAGADCEEVGRFKDRIKDICFLRKIYTEKEIHYCLSKPNPEQHLAARFAGKEAVIKALYGLGLKRTFHDIEILNYSKGMPFARIKGLEDIEVSISLSHTKDIALAFVIAQKTS